MMKYRWSTIFFLAVTFLPFPSLYAHGVSGKIDAGGVVVTGQYDTGEPMSYAKVKISAPGARLTFQSGRTDRNGRFCFFPDAAGEWNVVVDDEMGHRLEVNVPVNEQIVWQEKEQSGETSTSTLSRYQKALMGVCIIFGVSGIFFWWRGKKGRVVS
ncbi:MAG: hypothetical protein IMF18_09985 [Proteobacteria bacterium]|nr:hypothetical protein [Pseudomonadota bacterium]